MKRTAITCAILFLSGIFWSASAMAHCEIPCGIYDDNSRITLIEEHITTIEKSMKMIKKLEDGSDMNQLVRWVMNKEDHANELQHIVTQYFMTQRIKLDAKDYDKKMAALHKLLIYAMKAKQSVDMAYIASLRDAIKEFHDLYSHTH